MEQPAVRIDYPEDCCQICGEKRGSRECCHNAHRYGIQHTHELVRNPCGELLYCGTPENCTFGGCHTHSISIDFGK
jgi:hypothetical protein